MGGPLGKPSPFERAFVRETLALLKRVMDEDAILSADLIRQGIPEGNVLRMRRGTDNLTLLSVARIANALGYRPLVRLTKLPDSATRASEQ